LTPLRSFGKAYTAPAGAVDPNIDMQTAVREQVNKLDSAAYFKLMAALMRENPPAPGDAGIVGRMAKIGLVPGEEFDMGKFEAPVAAAIKGVPKLALARIVDHVKAAGVFKNGWMITQQTGVYGTDYLQRATIAYFGLGANRPLDAIYPTSESDANGDAYSGTNKYVMHFAKGHLPPVNAFWSLTMYNRDYFFVDSPLNRYTLSQRDKLKFNADGSVDLYLQADDPGKEKEANWLPAPKDKFILMLRLYWPKESSPSILDGSWNPPPARRVN
jgi:hypothetical protein